MAGFSRLRRESSGSEPEPGLIAWIDLPDPIVAAGVDQALTIALDVARGRWPLYDRNGVPFSSGTTDP